MASTGERSSRDGSRPRRLRTLSVPLPPTSQTIPPPPTSQGLPPAPTSQQLPLPLTLQQIAPSSSPQGSSAASASSVAGPSAPSAPSWGRGTGRRGPTRGVTERRLPDGQQWNVSLVRGYGVGPTADHFTSRLGVISNMYCKIWQKDFVKLPVATQELIFRYLQLTYQWEHTEKTYREMLAHMSAMHRSWHDAIASVPAGVDPSDWQRMCEMWTTGDEREAMNEMIALSDVDAESQPTATPEDAFISVMEKDRPGRVRCAGSGETLRTWYGSTSTEPSAYSERERQMQEHLKVQEGKLKAQADKMNQMEEKISQLQSVASKVDEMSLLLSQIQASQARTQPVPPPVQSESDSETDDYLDHDDPVSRFPSYFITLSYFLLFWIFV
ncbi:hypothetical protein Taro_022301 [Colocasia esculenta]|uniref:Uncharacterized protein n=1 Tax=Colocasia esculenta TaxID=4460 RepID=A0A843V3H4_COLES|nr:hypothetical protein [Colocasia esculenta]